MTIERFGPTLPFCEGLSSTPHRSGEGPVAAGQTTRRAAAITINPDRSIQIDTTLSWGPPTLNTLRRDGMTAFVHGLLNFTARLR